MTEANDDVTEDVGVVDSRSFEVDVLKTRDSNGQVLRRD
jgi:hypothetical protein